jgi:hypothetical protein
MLTWEQFCERQYQKKAEEIEVTIKLRENGGDRRSSDFQSNNCNTEKIERRGNDHKYLAARIARDHPDELANIGKGKKYRTVHAAAVSLGIKKDDKRYQLPTEILST